MPIRRGSRYWYCASSTCKRPSFVLARWAKISRISPLRSSTCTPRSSVSTRICEGDRSLSKIAIVASVEPISSLISATLPSPMKLRGFGDGRFCSTVATLTAPAVSTSAASSSMLSSSALSALSTGEERPTSTTRSRGCSTVLSLFSSIGITFSAFLSFSIRKGTKNVKKKRSASADLFRSSYLSRPNFLLNLATRPPVSTSFCLPVKKG